MRIYLIDSHRYMQKAKEDKLVDFFCEVKQLSEEDALKQVHFCDWYEKAYAVKWYEVVAYDDNRVVGYLRCFRNPEDPVEWYIGDVHVRASHRNKSIATRMYQKIIAEIRQFEVAERIIASVFKSNTKSIGLHTKMGFVDTGKKGQFPNLFFDDNETIYELKLITYYPALDYQISLNMLKHTWEKYGKYDISKLEELLDNAINKEELEFQIAWCGNRIVGFSYWNDEIEEDYLCE